jgi:hypothetical protein
MLSSIRSPQTLTLLAILLMGGFLLTRPKEPLQQVSVAPQEKKFVNEPALPSKGLVSIQVPGVNQGMAIPVLEAPIQMSASSESTEPVIPGNEISIPIGDGASLAVEPPLVQIPAANNEPEFYGEAIPLAPIPLAARTDTQQELPPLAPSPQAGAASASPFFSGISSIGSGAAQSPSVNSSPQYGSAGSASSAASPSATTLSALDLSRLTQPMSAGLDLSPLDVSAEQCVQGESSCAQPSTVSFPRSRWSLTKGVLAAATLTAQEISGAIPVRFVVTITLQGIDGTNTPINLSLTPSAVNSVPGTTTAQGQQKIYEFDFANVSTPVAGSLKNLHLKLVYSIAQGAAVLQAGSSLQFDRMSFETMTTPWSPGGSNPEIAESVPYIRVSSANYRVLLGP